MSLNLTCACNIMKNLFQDCSSLILYFFFFLCFQIKRNFSQVQPVEIEELQVDKWSRYCSEELVHTQPAVSAQFTWPPARDASRTLRDLYIYGALESACTTVGSLRRTFYFAMDTLKCKSKM